LVARVGLAPQGEFDLLELLDRCGLQLLEALRIGVEPVVLELAQIAQNVFEVARAHAGLLQLAPQRLGIVGPLAPLVAELPDVVRIPAIAVPSAAVAAPVARVAAVRAAVLRRAVAVAAVGRAPLLTALRLRTALTV